MQNFKYMGCYTEEVIHKEGSGLVALFSNRVAGFVYVFIQ